MICPPVHTVATKSHRSIPMENIQPLLDWLSSSGITICIILIGLFIFIIVVGSITNRIEKTVLKRTSSLETNKRITTLIGVMRLVLRTFLIIIAGMLILSELGIDLAPLLATVGLLGLAVSFGAQTLVKDLISGVFILIEDKIRVGDVITVDGFTGTVESVQIRVVVLRAVNGDLHVLPNGSINQFTNHTKDFSRALWNIGVGYSEQVDRVIEVLKDEGQAFVNDPDWSEKIQSEFTVMGLNELGDSAIVVRCLLDTLPGQQWAITREFNRRIKNRLDKEGIEIPFPHRTVYFGNHLVTRPEHDQEEKE